MKKVIILLVCLLLIQFVFSQSFNGFALYNSQGSNTTYLIDENQNIAGLKKWMDDRFDSEMLHYYRLNPIDLNH